MKTILTIAAIVFPYLCIGQWEFMGLKGKDINRLRIHANHIYAATNQGLFKKEITTTDTLWTLIGFPSKEVNCIYLRNNNVVYAGVAHAGAGSDTTALYISNNGGSTWDALWGGYDNDEQLYTQITDIEASSLNTSQIIVIGAGIRKSNDGGSTFLKVNSTGGRFLTMAPGNDNNVWTGGEGVLLNPYLVQSIDNGDSWSFNNNLQQVVTGDNASLSAAVHPADAGMVYVGMEGQVGKTTDNGTNWTKHLECEYYIKGITISPSSHNIIYATGGRFGGTEIPLFVSNDSGTTWDTLKHPMGSQVDSRELAVSNYTGTDIAYVSPYLEGVYKYTTTTTSLPSTTINKLTISIYPNPFNQTATVKYTGEYTGCVILEVSDIAGRTIDIYKPSVKGEIEINRENLPAGYYQLLLKDITGVIASQKMVVD